VYYDVAQDFAVLKVDPNETTYELTAVELGSAETLRVGDPVLIIGNNEGYVFSAIEGVVSDLRALSDTAGVRPSLDIETTFDSSSGSSGSPVRAPTSSAFMASQMPSNCLQINSMPT